jgi:hypothetical protein
MIANNYTTDLTVKQRAAISKVRKYRFSQEYIKRVWMCFMDYFDRDWGFYSWCVAKAYDEAKRKVGK